MAKDTIMKPTKPGGAQRPRNKSGHFIRQSKATVPVSQQRPTVTMTQQNRNETTIQTSQLVTVVESQRLVQTLMMDCVSSLTRSRYMFPPECYEQRFVSYSESEASKTLAPKSRAPHVQEQSLQPQGRSFFALKKGVSARVDRLIHLMENGILDAIKRGFLKIIRFAIFEYPDRPDNRLEEWSLAVSYSTDASTGIRHMSGINLSEDRQGKNITLTQAKNSLGRFMQDLATYTFFLPQLPDVVQMTIELDFTEDTPVNYCPPEFGVSETDVSRFPNTDEWENANIPIGKMNTGPHRVSLMVAHLRRRDGDGPNIVPAGLACTNEVRRDANMELFSIGDHAVSVTADTSSLRTQPKKPPEIDPCSSPPTVGRNGNLDLSGSQVSIRPSLMPEIVSDSVQPSSADVHLRDRITRMLPVPAINETVEETQMLEAQPRADDYHHERVAFLESTIKFLDDNMDIDIPMRQGHSAIMGTDQMIGQDVSIRCDCRGSTHEGGIIHCQFCDYYQHIVCYGYHGDTDARIPTTHVCYTCLLAGEDAQQLAMLQDRARCRRALYQLQKRKRFDNRKQMAKDLGWSESLCNQIHKGLQAQGLLMATRSKNQIVLNQSEDTKESINAAYFSPSTGIERYLQSPLRKSTEIARPVTPCGNLDSNGKRGLDEEDTASQPAKKPCTSRQLLTGFTVGPDYSTPKANQKH